MSLSQIYTCMQEVERLVPEAAAAFQKAMAMMGWSALWFLAFAKEASGIWCSIYSQSTRPHLSFRVSPKYIE